MSENGYDCQGHRTLGLFGMLLYYRDQPKSCELIRSRPSYQLKIVPSITIKLQYDQLPGVKVILIYPREHVTREVILDEEHADFLRDLFRSPVLNWEVEKHSNRAVFFHKGYILPSETPTPLLNFWVG